MEQAKKASDKMINKLNNENLALNKKVKSSQAECETLTSQLASTTEQLTAIHKKSETLGEHLTREINANVELIRKIDEQKKEIISLSQPSNPSYFWAAMFILGLIIGAAIGYNAPHL